MKILFLMLLIVANWALAETADPITQVAPESIDHVKLLSTFLLFEFAVIAFLLFRLKRHKDEAKANQSKLELLVQSQKKSLDELQQSQSNSLNIDALTGIKNRNFLYQQIKQLILDKPENSWDLILISIDEFKSINKTYGHLAGDDVIKTLADFLTHQLKLDTVVRWGDKELLCLIKTEPNSNQQLVNHIQDFLSKQTIKAQGHSLAIKTSIGTTQFPIHEYKNLDWEWSVKLMHHALLKAQESEQIKWGGVQLNPGKQFDYATSDSVGEMIDSGVLKLIKKR